MSFEFDYIFVGAGLTSALCVLSLAERHPGARVALVDKEARALGNHTWCFHQDDVPAEAQDFVAPAIATSWPAYDVRFPSYVRTLTHRYCAVSVPSLQSALDRACKALRVETVWGAHCA